MKNISKMLIIIPVITLIFANSLIRAQAVSTVKGKVIDRETGYPLEAASVYFAQTTIGAMVNKSGQFTIEVTKPGNYELVVSMVGYELQKLGISVYPGKEYNYEFKLVPKVTEIAAVEVVAEGQDEWKNSMEVFKIRLLGTLASAEECTIKNIEYVDFKKENDAITAYCTKPISIISNYLGYEIIVELSFFYYNPLTRELKYSFIPRYIELIPKDESQKERWAKSREEIYYGSPEHFLWALKNDKLLTEGFEVSRSATLNFKTLSVGNEAIIKSWKDLRYKEEFGNEPILFFPGYLKISYKKASISCIKLIYPFFTIDEFGRADNHLPFECSGFWGKYGLASRLPIDYLPASLKK